MRTPEKVEIFCDRCGNIFFRVIDCACSNTFHYQGGELLAVKFGEAYDHAAEWEKSQGCECIQHDVKVLCLCDECLKDCWVEYMTAKGYELPIEISRVYRKKGSES